MKHWLELSEVELTCVCRRIVSAVKTMNDNCDVSITFHEDGSISAMKCGDSSGDTEIFAFEKDYVNLNKLPEAAQ